MSMESSSLDTDKNNIENIVDINSNDRISERQRPNFDEKHVQKILFVECGMFLSILPFRLIYL